MEAWLTTLSALAAVVLGGGISFGTTWLLERAKRRQDRAARWDERRVEAILAYGQAVKREVRILLRAATDRGWARTAPLDREAALVLHSEAEHERSLRLEPLLLLTDAATVAAARRWQQAAWELQHVVLHSGEQTTSGDFDAAYSACGRARDGFYRAARAVIDVPADAALDAELEVERAPAERRY